MSVAKFSSHSISHVAVAFAALCLLVFALMGVTAIAPAQAHAATSIGKTTVSSVSAQAYTGKSIRPYVTVKYKGKTLRRNTDFRVTYSTNKAVGTGTLVVWGRGRYSGKRTIRFAIRYSLAKYGSVTLSRSNLAYTGATRKPAVAVFYSGKRLTNTRDYRLEFSNTVHVGTASVSIVGIGSYGFRMKRTYAITADAGRVVDLSEWNTVTNYTTLSQKVDLAVLRSYVMFSDHSQSRADLSYNAFATGCEKAKLPYGAYGFMNFTSQSDAIKQADAFWDASFSNGHEPLFLALDLETVMMEKEGTQVAIYARVCMDELQKKAKAAGYKNGIKVGLYIANHYYADYGFTTTTGKSVISKAGFVWIPTYGKNNGAVPALPTRPSYAYDMWQFTSKGSIGGVSGNCDVSRISSKGPHAHNMGWYVKH